MKIIRQHVRNQLSSLGLLPETADSHTDLYIVLQDHKQKSLQAAVLFNGCQRRRPFLKSYIVKNDKNDSKMRILALLITDENRTFYGGISSQHREKRTLPFRCKDNDGIGPNTNIDKARLVKTVKKTGYSNSSTWFKGFIFYEFETKVYIPKSPQF